MGQIRDRIGSDERGQGGWRGCEKKNNHHRIYSRRLALGEGRNIGNASEEGEAVKLTEAGNPVRKVS